MKSRARDKLIVALSCFVGGVFVLLVGLGIFQLDEPMHAPRFVVALVGSAFMAAGGLLLWLPKRSWALHILAFCCYLGLTTAFWWAAIAAPSKLFEGNLIPFVTQELNVKLARCLFGTVAFLGTTVVIYAPIAMLKKRFK